MLLEIYDFWGVFELVQLPLPNSGRAGVGSDYKI